MGHFSAMANHIDKEIEVVAGGVPGTPGSPADRNQLRIPDENGQYKLRV